MDNAGNVGPYCLLAATGFPIGGRRCRLSLEQGRIAEQLGQQAWQVRPPLYNNHPNSMVSANLSFSTTRRASSGEVMISISVPMRFGSISRSLATACILLSAPGLV